MNYQYIFWDNDGVLVDTERFYLQASQEALDRVGLSMSHDQFASLSLTHGLSIFDLAKEAGADDQTICDLREWRNNRYSHLLAQQQVAIDGAEQVIKTLFGQVRMAIVTSSLRQHFEIIHQRTGFLGYMEFALTREDYKQSKPAGEPYLLALEKSGVSAEQVLVIEDSPRGLTAAKQAGLSCWVIPSPYVSEEEFRCADKILGDIKELPNLIL